MENLKSTKKLCEKYNKMLLLDACRFAENAWFVSQREEDYKGVEILEESWHLMMISLPKLQGTF
jgi:tryptophanase